MAFYGLSNVVKQSVYTIYSEVKSTLIRKIYHREIKPFQQHAIQSSGETAIVLKQPLFIFWTNISIQTKTEALIENNFYPNHLYHVF